MREGYFAFGSNMSRARLEARVGPVLVLGRASLAGCEHRFDKLGIDGTAKGNIMRVPRGRVLGVLYELSPAQLRALAGFEIGYDGRRVEVRCANVTRGATVFVAASRGCSVAPSLEYLRHYARGLREHEIDPAYWDELVAGLDPALLRSL